MEVFAAIRGRRSIRKFLDRDVDDAAIKGILEAARWAPTGGNMQPWEFVVVRDPGRKKRLVDNTYSGYLEKGGNPQRWIMSAPAVVVACVNQKRTGARYGEPGKRIALMDTSAAIQNVLLAITSAGLACCWVSGFTPDGISEV
ncbi:MAG: nitroreductase family protein, partial [Bacillota bacterium]